MLRFFATPLRALLFGAVFALLISIPKMKPGAIPEEILTLPLTTYLVGDIVNGAIIGGLYYWFFGGLIARKDRPMEHRMLFVPVLFMFIGTSIVSFAVNIYIGFDLARAFVQEVATMTIVIIVYQKLVQKYRTLYPRGPETPEDVPGPK